MTVSVNSDEQTAVDVPVNVIGIHPFLPDFSGRPG